MKVADTKTWSDWETGFISKITLKKLQFGYGYQISNVSFKQQLTIKKKLFEKSLIGFSSLQLKLIGYSLVAVFY